MICLATKTAGPKSTEEGSWWGKSLIRREGRAISNARKLPKGYSAEVYKAYTIGGQTFGPSDLL
jgi:hypothetical protein